MVRRRASANSALKGNPVSVPGEASSSAHAWMTCRSFAGDRASGSERRSSDSPPGKAPAARYGSVHPVAPGALPQAFAKAALMARFNPSGTFGMFRWISGRNSAAWVSIWRRMACSWKYRSAGNRSQRSRSIHNPTGMERSIDIREVRKHSAKASWRSCGSDALAGWV